MIGIKSEHKSWGQLGSANATAKQPPGAQISRKGFAIIWAKCTLSHFLVKLQIGAHKLKMSQMLTDNSLLRY